MKNLSNLLNRISSWKTLLLFSCIYMLFNGYILKNAEEKINTLSGNSNGVIDLTFGFNPQKTLEMVSAYSPEARGYYAQTEMTTDVAYPIVYAVLFGIILTLLFSGKLYSPNPLINLLPFVSLIFDYLENITIVNLLKSYPIQNETVALFCEIFKMVKWISFLAIIGFIFYGLVRLIILKLRPTT